MNTVEIYDPALCCSTGVCGPTPDSDLTAFASTLEKLKAQGIAVSRHNLAQEPLAFAQNAAVKSILETEGDSALPLVFIDGTLQFRGAYPTAAQLEQALAPAAKQPIAFSKVDAPKATVKPSSCCDPSSGCC